ncbi:hypothetical protein G8770_10820 [Aestuariicella hydrocarbonica]|uniref:Uncharacterized protein n=1 Tax=Pseudomaricurvus hydrocarbonicus TaxID=1470433 RepID=A0A9E5MHK3_9GAMM|nr:hypothetical protein [Aestuariicella hydrocarbonica]NHO66036.1 hypothetical protein [Aestuariicella hydrocarbonica]
MDQTKYNVMILREALNALATTTEEQLRLNKEGLAYLDDIFDTMPLDFLPWLEECGVVGSKFANDFRELYGEIDSTLSQMSWEEEDDFIKSNCESLREWRVKANTLLGQLASL